MKKRWFSLLLVCLLLLPQLAYAQQFDTVAGYAALVEMSTGQFIYLKNADEPRPPASITKVMTLLLAFEALERGDIQWDQKTVVSERAWRISGSEMFLDVNTEVSVEDLIKGISIVSANDGCIAIAELIAGSEEAFVQRMNQRAQELGMQNTLFRNSTGLPAEGHVMSARDIAILSRHLVANFPKILEFETMREFTYNNIKQYNRNPLLGRFQGADGLKTGWTPESGYSLAGTALQNDMRLISVVLNTTSEEERFTASSELLNYGFRNFRLKTAAKAGDVLGQAPVKDGRQQTVDVAVAKDITVVIPTGQEKNLELVTQPEVLTAPVGTGSPAGTLLVRLDGETVATAPLEAKNDVGRANIVVRLFRAIGNFFRGLLARGRS